ncbi:MAG: ATPase [Alphaproteobacteria bacterium]|nr:ATPase [Alphaproteobacteria bacterium]
MSKKPYIIVLGNEKGGTGKSTTAMHVMTALLRLGYKVGSIDIDARQGTLSRYIQNRETFAKNYDIDLPMPLHYRLERSKADSIKAAEAEDQTAFEKAILTLQDCDFIVIDTPGHDLYLSRLAHSYADTLITPLNDSFIDLDVLAHLKSDSLELEKPSIYADWVWEQKKHRAVRDRGSIDWIVLRNRLSHIHAHNKEKMEGVLNTLAKRLAFRQVPGFSERVIFRELFLSGLTLLDLQDVGRPLTLSHVAAKQELRNLMNQIKVAALEEKIKEVL